MSDERRQFWKNAAVIFFAMFIANGGNKMFKKWVWIIPAAAVAAGSVILVVKKHKKA